MATYHYKKSKGLGDTIEKITTMTGVKRIVENVSHAIGEDCGCEARKKALNNPDLLVNKIFYNTTKKINK